MIDDDSAVAGGGESAKPVGNYVKRHGLEPVGKRIKAAGVRVHVPARLGHLQGGH